MCACRRYTARRCHRHLSSPFPPTSPTPPSSTSRRALLRCAAPRWTARHTDRYSPPPTLPHHTPHRTTSPARVPILTFYDYTSPGFTHCPLPRAGGFDTHPAACGQGDTCLGIRLLRFGTFTGRRAKRALTAAAHHLPTPPPPPQTFYRGQHRHVTGPRALPHAPRTPHARAGTGRLDATIPHLPLPMVEANKPVHSTYYWCVYQHYIHTNWIFSTTVHTKQPLPFPRQHHLPFRQTLFKHPHHQRACVVHLATFSCSPGGGQITPSSVGLWRSHYDNAVTALRGTRRYCVRTFRALPLLAHLPNAAHAALCAAVSRS